MMEKATKESANCQYDQEILLVDRNEERCSPTCKHLQIMPSISTKQGLHTANVSRNSMSTICQLCNGFHWTTNYNIERKQIHFNAHLFANILFKYSATEY